MKSENEYVKWSDTYSMGIKIVDDQHKGLLEFVNDLFNHSTGNEKEERAYFKKVIDQAVQYIKVHFETEEKLMIATKFPGYAEHKKAHARFTLAVVDSANDFESGKKRVLAKFATFLKDWILTHIAIMDVQYAAYIKSIAASKTDSAANMEVH
ncbi:MAG: bacteriohemerythrin [Treponema sp.]|jgi:hemerythrin|nr:bacteriohemerythrin [Treponema sp.]